MLQSQLRSNFKAAKQQSQLADSKNGLRMDTTIAQSALTEMQFFPFPFFLFSFFFFLFAIVPSSHAIVSDTAKSAASECKAGSPPVCNARLCYCRCFLFLLRTVSVPCSPTMSLVPFISMQPSTVLQGWPCSRYSILCARCFLPGLCAIESVCFNVTQSLLHLRSPFISYHVQLQPSCALLWCPLVPRYPARDSCAPQFCVSPSSAGASNDLWTSVLNLDH